MADIFTSKDAQNLLKAKTIWFLGDSNVRGMYKDLVCLLQKNSLIGLNGLKGKLEQSFMNDLLIKGHSLGRGRDYKEVRQYTNLQLNTTVEFMFLTKCLTSDLEMKLEDLKLSSRNKYPDVVVMNSCLWDIARWGPSGVSNYKENIIKLANLFKTHLPSKTLVIWTTTPPLAAEPYGGFLIKQIEFMKHTIRFEVMEANMYVRQELVSRGFDVLDVHYHLLLQIHRRRPDGIHWNVDAVRHITNLLLTHISLSWNQQLPGNFISPILTKMQNFDPEPVIEASETLKKLNCILDSVQPSSKKNEDKQREAKGRTQRRQNASRRERTCGSNSRSEGEYWEDTNWNSNDFFDFDTKSNQSGNHNNNWNFAVQTIKPLLNFSALKNSNNNNNTNNNGNNNANNSNSSNNHRSSQSGRRNKGRRRYEPYRPY